MGSTNASQDWKHDYEIIPTNNFDPTKTRVKSKDSLKEFQMITIYLSSHQQVDTFLQRLRKRQNFKSKYLVPFQKVYHSEDKNLCGNNFRYDLIIPKTQSCLLTHFPIRKSKGQSFHIEEVMYVIYNSCQALKDLKAMEDQHGNVNLQTLVILNNEVLLEDPIISNRNQSESQNYRTKKIEGYPSPAILFHQIDSGMRIQKFKEDLFSLGLVALQMLNPDINIKSVYQNKNAKYQNTRINFELVSNQINNIRAQPLKQWISILLHQNSEERLHIYPMIENYRPNSNNIDFSKDNSKDVIPMHQRSTYNPQPQHIQNQQPPYPRPQLTFSSAHSQKMMVESQIVGNQVFQPHQGKVSFRSIPEVQNNTLTHPLVYQPQSQVQNIHFNTPTFNKAHLPIESSPDKQYQQPPILHLRQQQPQKQAYGINANRPQAPSSTLPQTSLPQPPPHLPSKSQVSQQRIAWQSNDYIKYSSTMDNQGSEKYIDNYYEQIPKYERIKQRQLQIEKSIEYRSKEEKVENNRQVREKYNEQLKKEIQELEKIRKENEEIQKIIDSGATNLFQKQGLSLPQPQIRELTEEDSRIQQAEAQFVMEDYEDGNRYEGFIKDKLRNGYGKFYYKGGSIYDGQWKNNQMNGYGTLFYPQGKIAYQGHWKNDQFHGKGNIYNDNPQIIKGSFDYTNFKKMEGDQWYSYEGQCEVSKKHGKGKLTLSNGQVYEGQFYMDFPHGLGIFTENRGNKVKGTWSDGILKTIVD